MKASGGNEAPVMSVSVPLDASTRKVDMLVRLCMKSNSCSLNVTMLVFQNLPLPVPTNHSCTPKLDCKT